MTSITNVIIVRMMLYKSHKEDKMKFFKSLLTISLSALIALSANAETEKVAPKTEKTASKTEKAVPKTEKAAPKTEKATSKTEKAAPKTEKSAPKAEKTTPKVSPKVTEKSVQKNAAQTKQDAELKRFTDTISVKFLGATVSVNDQNQQILDFKYAVSNKSKRNIRSVHWKASYLHNNTAILEHDMPVSFKNNLKRNTTSEIVFSIPFSNLPEETQALLKQGSVNLGVRHEAKSIVFSNGSKILVQQ